MLKSRCWLELWSYMRLWSSSTLMQAVDWIKIILVVGLCFLADCAFSRRSWRWCSCPSNPAPSKHGSFLLLSQQEVPPLQSAKSESYTTQPIQGVTISSFSHVLSYECIYQHLEIWRPFQILLPHCCDTEDSGWGKTWGLGQLDSGPVQMQYQSNFISLLLKYH